MFISWILAAASPASSAPPANAAIDFQTALLVVMAVCLAFMARALNKLSQRVRDLTEKSVTPARPHQPTDAAPSPRDRETFPEPAIIAAITAAAIVALNRPVRVVSVDEVARQTGQTWSLEGRRQIFTSHQIR